MPNGVDYRVTSVVVGLMEFLTGTPPSSCATRAFDAKYMNAATRE
jgi:hypothetical protein